MTTQDIIDINVDLVKVNQKDLIENLKRVYLQMQDILGIDPNITFGTEIEIVNVGPKKLYTYTMEKKSYLFNYAIPGEKFFNPKMFSNPELLKRWNIFYEVLLHGGLEINSPILRDKKNTWKEFTNICNILKILKCIPHSNHIHIGAQIMKDDSKYWVNLLKLWSIYENVIYRFAYGENLNYRRTLPTYAKNIRNEILFNIKDIELTKDIFKLMESSEICEDKCHGLSFYKIYLEKLGNIFKEDNTIEIRCPNGTIEPEVWQNYINFFIKLILYANNENFDTDFINYKFKNLERGNLLSYNKLDLLSALELVDMIFNNNLDKINFLKQYYKDGLESNNFKDKVKLVL